MQNTAFTSQPEVAIVDAYGNIVPAASSSVTLAITTGTGTTGAALTCSANALSTSSGIATFAGCRIDLVGTGYTLTAAGAYAAANSSAVAIAAGAPVTTAVYSGSGGSAVVDTAFASPLVALVTDGQGSPVPGVAVTFAAPSSGASGSFPGPVTTASAVTDQDGRATAPTLTAGTVAGSFTVTASAIGTTAATFSLTDTPAAAVKLAFTQSPSATTAAGTPFAAQPTGRGAGRLREHRHERQELRLPGRHGRGRLVDLRRELARGSRRRGRVRRLLDGEARDPDPDGDRRVADARDQRPIRDRPRSRGHDRRLVRLPTRPLPSGRPT